MQKTVEISTTKIPGNLLFINPELLAQAKKSVAILIPCTYSCCRVGNFNQTALSLGQCAQTVTVISGRVQAMTKLHCLPVWSADEPLAHSTAHDIYKMVLDTQIYRVTYIIKNRGHHFKPICYELKYK